MGLFFMGAGVMHFVRPSFYFKIMPPWMPFPFEVVLLSGFFEILLGLMALFEKTRCLAGWGLIALLLAVFPANLQMALHPELFSTVPPPVLWLRLPFQGILIFWVGQTCLRKMPKGRV